MWAALWVINYRSEFLVVLFLDKLSAILAALLDTRGRWISWILQDKYASSICRALIKIEANKSSFICFFSHDQIMASLSTIRPI